MSFSSGKPVEVVVLRVVLGVAVVGTLASIMLIIISNHGFGDPCDDNNFFKDSTKCWGKKNGPILLGIMLTTAVLAAIGLAITSRMSRIKMSGGGGGLDDLDDYYPGVGDYEYSNDAEAGGARKRRGVNPFDEGKADESADGPRPARLFTKGKRAAASAPPPSGSEYNSDDDSNSSSEYEYEENPSSDSSEYEYDDGYMYES